MTPLGNDLMDFRYLLEDDLDDTMDYECDIDFVVLDVSILTTTTCEDNSRRASNSFRARGATDTLTVLR